jgi:Ser/Thr protein kinase RdoA (MazF antagonist)
MNNHSFPVDKSLLSAAALSRVIEAEYGLAAVRCQLLTATLRDVYLVSSNEGRYVGYVYRHEHRPTDEIRAEWQFVDYLSANGVPVAPAVRRVNGELLLAFHAQEGVRYGVLTHFAPGKHLRQRPSAAAVNAYGRIVAQIHVLADLMPQTLKRPPIDVEDLLRRSIAAFAAEVPDRPQDLAFMQESAATLLPRIEALTREEPYYGLIHGDVIRANAQVGDDGSVTILDFDLCGYCWRAYDVASYLAVIRGLPGEKESERAFLSGYQQVRPLKDVEMEALLLFEAVRTIVSIGIPAMNVYHWGSAYLHSFLDYDLDRLRHMMSVIG